MGTSPVRRVVGLHSEFTGGDIPSSAKEGGSFSSSSSRSPSSWFCGVCSQGSTVYRNPGFYEFGVKSRSAPVDTVYIVISCM